MKHKVLTRMAILFALFISAAAVRGCSSGNSSVEDVVDTSDPVDTGDPLAEEDVVDVPVETGPDAPPDSTDGPDPGEPPEVIDLIEEEDSPPLHFPIEELDDLKLYINIGDSLAAGYDADGENSRGGKGYARLMMDNHPDYPAYLGHHLAALYPGVQFRDLSHSGDTSSDALDRVQDASWPGVDGDVLVSLTCGGNDFNDDFTTMILRSATEAAASRLQSNYREIVTIIRSRYEDTVAGHNVVFLITNIHDPTAGTGAIPPGYDDGFCSLLNDPRLIPLRATAIGNLNFFNAEILEVIIELGGCLVDNHGVFFDHGMNASEEERWISNDCVHPFNEGHHQLRREEWYVLTGERY